MTNATIINLRTGLTITGCIDAEFEMPEDFRFADSLTTDEWVKLVWDIRGDVYDAESCRRVLNAE
jgi:hypothetical protein